MFVEGLLNARLGERCFRLFSCSEMITYRCKVEECLAACLEELCQT